MEIMKMGLVSPQLAALSDAVAPTTLSADPLTTARFAEVMGVAPAVPESPSPAVVQAALSAPQSLGENILSGMQNLSSDFQQSWKTVNAALDSNNMMTTQDMLKLQMGLTQVSIQYELVGKAISRSTQNLDQLVKLQ